MHKTYGNNASSLLQSQAHAENQANCIFPNGCRIFRQKETLCNAMRVQTTLSNYGVNVVLPEGSGWRGGLGGPPAPLVVLSAGGMCSPLLLFQALQKWQLGF